MSVVVEDKLMALFELIPERTYMQSGLPYTTPKPTYHFGGSKECNKFIVAMKREVFPLIYQTSNSSTGNDKSGYVTTDITLILATHTSTTLLNDQRWATTYRNILMPLLDDVLNTFKRSQIIAWDGDYTVENLPNYSATDAQDQNAFVDIVDAVVFSATITIDGRKCVDKNLIYKR